MDASRQNTSESDLLRFNPKTINDFVGLDSQRKTIEKWLIELLPSALLITGPSGSGKTSFILKILSENGYIVHHFNTYNFNKRGIISNQLHKSLSYNNMSILQGHSKKHAIIIDELEGISVTDRGSMTEIIDIIKNLDGKINKKGKNLGLTKKKIPFICIGNEQYIKKIKDLEKLCLHIHFPQPQKQYIIERIANICSNNKMSITKDGVLSLVKACQNDFKKLHILLNYLTLDAKDKYKSNDINSIVNSIMLKGKDISLYKACYILFYGNPSVKDAIQFYNSEKTLQSLMIHQNYLNIVSSYTKNSAKLSNYIYKIAKCFSDSDIIEKYLYSENEWELYEVYGFISCYMPSYFFRNVRTNKSITKPDIDFAKLLNRTSLQYTYKHTLRKLIGVGQSKNYYYFDRNTIKYNNNKIKYLSNSERYDECNDLLKKYQLELSEVDKIIKCS